MNPWHMYIIYKPTDTVIRDVRYSFRSGAQKAARNACGWLGTEYFDFQVRGPGEALLTVSAHNLPDSIGDCIHDFGAGPYPEGALCRKGCGAIFHAERSVHNGN